MSSTPLRVQRPLTASGIAGLRRPTQTRQAVRDVHYYKSFLGLTIQELEAEITKVKTRTSELKTALNSHEDVHREHESLRHEVHKLRMDLYDINAASEKLRQKNKDSGRLLELRDSVDTVESGCSRLVAAKQKIQTLLEETKLELESKQTQWETLIGGLEKDKRGQMERLRSELDVRTDNCSELKQRYAQLRSQVDSVRAQLESDPNLVAKLEVEKGLSKKTAEIQKIDSELLILHQPLPEQRELILKAVKEMNTEQAMVDAEMLKVAQEIAASEAAVADIRTDCQDRSEKYDLISAKKAEIDNFLARFGPEAERMSDRINVLQAQAGAFSERLAQLQERERAAPEVEFLQRELMTSETTSKKLEAELSERKQELDRLDNIESTYLDELNRINSEMKETEDRIAALSDVARIRAEKVNQSASIEERLRAVGEACRKVESKLKVNREERDSLSERLTADPVHQKLSQAENRLQRVMNEIDTLNRRTNEEMLVDERKQLSSMMQALNDLIISNM